MTSKVKIVSLVILGLTSALMSACTPADQTATSTSYAPMDHHALTAFSLEVVPTQNDRAEPLSLGMLSGMFSEGTLYQLNNGHKAAPIRVAEASARPETRNDSVILRLDTPPPKTQEQTSHMLRPARSDYFGL